MYTNTSRVESPPPGPAIAIRGSQSGAPSAASVAAESCRNPRRESSLYSVHAVQSRVFIVYLRGGSIPLETGRREGQADALSDLAGRGVRRSQVRLHRRHIGGIHGPGEDDLVDLG